MSVPWQELVADKKKRQAASIPREWLITLPPDDVLDVTKVPEECGLLSPQELEITNTVDVDTILRNLATSKWSAVEVTLAFYKRAIIAQQVVSASYASRMRIWLSRGHHLLGQLLDRDIRRTCACPSKGTGRSAQTDR